MANKLCHISVNIMLHHIAGNFPAAKNSVSFFFITDFINVKMTNVMCTNRQNQYLLHEFNFPVIRKLKCTRKKKKNPAMQSLIRTIIVISVGRAYLVQLLISSDRGVMSSSGDPPSSRHLLKTIIRVIRL